MILKTLDNVQAICNNFLYGVRKFDCIGDEINEILKFLKLFNSTEVAKVENLIAEGTENEQFIYLERTYENGIDITQFDISPFLSLEFIDAVYTLFPFMRQLSYRVDNYTANFDIKSNTIQSLMYDLYCTSYRPIHRHSRTNIWRYLSYFNTKSVIHTNTNIIKCDIIKKKFYHPYFKIRFKTKKSDYYKNGLKCIAKIQFYSPTYSYCKRFSGTVVLDIDKSGTIYEGVAKKMCFNIFRNQVMQSITLRDFISSDKYILSELSDIVFDINPVTDKKINDVKGW